MGKNEKISACGIPQATNKISQKAIFMSKKEKQWVKKKRILFKRKLQIKMEPIIWILIKKSLFIYYIKELNFLIEVITFNKDNYDINTMCSILGVARSIYNWSNQNKQTISIISSYF